MNLADSITPNSDQLNADDLIAGPVTVTIVDVKAGSAEQPVDIVTAEYGPGRPYRPSKSMRRVMVAAWGPDTTPYKGRTLTLFRNPTIKFGREEVGGIQISHLSHIDKPLTVALTVTRGKRAPYVVKPAATQPEPPAARLTDQQGRDLGAGFTALGITDRPERLRYCSSVIGRDITEPTQLTPAEADAVLAEIQKDTDQ